MDTLAARATPHEVERRMKTGNVNGISGGAYDQSAKTRMLRNMSAGLDRWSLLHFADVIAFGYSTHNENFEGFRSKSVDAIFKIVI